VSLKIETLSAEKEFLAMRAQYERLYQRSLAPNIFFSPTWIYTWWEHFGTGKTPVLLSVRSLSGDLLALWPFVEVPCLFGSGLWPMSYHTADYFDPVVGSDDEEVTKVLIEGFFNLLGNYRFVWLPLLRETFVNTHFAPALARKNLRRIFRIASANPLIKAGSPDFKSFIGERLGTKTRRSIRYDETRLKKKGEVDYITLSSPSDIEAFMPSIDCIERASWKHEAGVGLFSLPGIRKFYYSLLPRLAQQDRVRISALMLDGKALVYEIGLVNSGYYGMHNTAFDQTFGSFSPGWLLMLHTIEQLFGEGVKTFDFMQGNQAYKRQLATHDEPLMEAMVFHRSAAGVSNYMAVRLVSALKRGARWVAGSKKKSP